ncbi:MAG: GntR family transcriptional regulator [Comamonadaceae bacterium]|nr:MAG: GntR family transcriptional regulator [Comamonadaceae bacterium]
MQFEINPSISVPIYRQIVDQVQRLVAGGGLRPGDELPSVRTVAALHAVNPMTVSKAYSLLEGQGLLQRLRGQGMVVAERAPGSSKSERLALLRPSLQAAAQQARQLEISPADALAAFRMELEGGNQ